MTRSNKGQEKLWFDQDDVSSGQVFQAGRKSATTPSLQLPKISKDLICLFKGIAFPWKNDKVPYNLQPVISQV